jgi:hypothetical protein
MKRIIFCVFITLLALGISIELSAGKTHAKNDAGKNSIIPESKNEKYKAATKQAIDCNTTKCCMAAGGQCYHFDPEHCFPHNCNRGHGGRAK